MATKQVLGKVSMVMRGEYNNETQYSNLDVVTYDGSSYVAKGPTLGNLPTNSIFWVLLAKKGDNKVFDSLQKLKEYYKFLNVGDNVKTLGYYELNDGGGAEYHITDTLDETKHQEQIGNLYAELIIKDNVNVKQFGAKGNDVDDDYDAIQNAINYCVNNSIKLFIPSGKYIISKGLVIEKLTIEIEGIKNKTIIKLVSDTPSVAITLRQPASYNTIKGIKFDGINYIHTGIKITGNRQGSGYTGANWKNTISECGFNFFDVGLIITTDRDPLDGTQVDFASENLFNHCKFKNNHTHCIFENMQSLNNLFLQTDFENEKDKDDGTYPMMINRGGGEFKFDTCSIMGAGIMYKITYPKDASNIFSDHSVTFQNCRLEIYENHDENLIYQDEINSTKYKINFINIENMTIYSHANLKINLINYVGFLYADIKNLYLYGYTKKMYICENTIAGSSNNIFDSLSSINIKNVVGKILYEKGSRSTGNKVYQGNITYQNNLEQYNSTKVDEYGFKDLTGVINFSRYNNNLNNVTVNNICLVQPEASYSFSNLKMILPKDLYLLKLYTFKQGNRYPIDTTINLYMVKDVKNWVNSSEFNKDTDAVLIAKIDNTLNKSGYFEKNITYTENYGNNVTTGNMEGYRECRYYIEIPSNNSSSGIIGISYI